MPKSTYIHIPFCRRKCGYCSFTSFDKLELKPIYIGSLLSEIDMFYDKTPQKTIYIGGGTPSLLSVGDFEEILSKFSLEKNPEITVELNPESTSPELLEGLHSLGVNRLSIGAQSFIDEELSLIGRAHNSSDIITTIKNARKSGFSNISVDLIYALPNQTLKSWEYNLKRVSELELEHLSLYGLKIDEGCYFYNHRPKNIPDDDMQADMYLKTLEVLSHFKHYEVSNFAKNEEFCGLHNINYWRAGQYFGFGTAACGFIEQGRYSNTRNIEEYIKNPRGEKAFECTNLLEEKIFLGLRMLDGINIEELNREFNIDFKAKYQSQLEKYDSYFIKKGDMLSLNEQGILVSNVILAEFLEE